MVLAGETSHRCQKSVVVIRPLPSNESNARRKDFDPEFLVEWSLRLWGSRARPKGEKWVFPELTKKTQKGMSSAYKTPYQPGHFLKSVLILREVVSAAYL